MIKIFTQKHKMDMGSNVGAEGSENRKESKTAPSRSSGSWVELVALSRTNSRCSRPLAGWTDAVDTNSNLS